MCAEQLKLKFKLKIKLKCIFLILKGSHSYTCQYFIINPALCYMFLFDTDKATNPLNKETDWDNIKGFCDQLDSEPEG